MPTLGEEDHPVVKGALTRCGGWSCAGEKVEGERAERGERECLQLDVRRGEATVRMGRQDSKVDRWMDSDIQA